MGLGAMFAALNTMYSAVSARTREIATLRALGFGAAPVVVSVLAEALLIGLIGGVIGMRDRLLRVQRHARLDHELRDLQPDHLRVHRDAGSC